MTTEKRLSYCRAPSQGLKELLSPGGFLAPLLDRTLLDLSGRYHDVHLRLGDHVNVYRGRTALLDVKRNGNEEIICDGYKSYREQSCAKGFFRTWRVDESGFKDALHNYLDNVEVTAEFITGEGEVQARWARVAEYQYVLWKHCPWIPFDREAVLKNGSRKKPDQLAVDRNGDLVIIELKDANSKSIDDAPSRILQYINEWTEALRQSPELWNQLQKLIDARKELELIPDSVPELNRDVGGVRAAICFGDYVHAACDNMGYKRPSLNMKNNYYKKLDDANLRLPSGVPPIETWKLDGKGPHQVVRSRQLGDKGRSRQL